MSRLNGVVVLCFLLMDMVALLDGFPFGAPQVACLSMVPGSLSPGFGHGSRPQTGAPPFRFRYRKDGSKYTVRLRSTQGGFRGFFLQARDDFDLPIGHFSNLIGRVKYVDCGLDKNAVTHTDSSIKTAVSVEWHDVDNYGLDRFVATVVTDINTYWVKVEAQEVYNLDEE